MVPAIPVKNTIIFLNENSPLSLPELNLRMQEMDKEAHKFKAREAAVLRAVPFTPQPVKRFEFDFVFEKLPFLN